jgi:hypothetical protein
MSFSGPLVCSAISGRSRTIDNSGLLASSRTSRRQSVTKPVLRLKMRSNRALQRSLALFRGGAAIGLEIAVEVPYRPANGGLGDAVVVGKGVELGTRRSE